MTIAFDAASNIGGSTFRGSWTHTPVGTPRGVFVMIGYNDTGIDRVTGVTYGGVALSRLQIHEVHSGEQCISQLWFLGSGLPTGAQSVVVSGTDDNPGLSSCITMTASGNTAIADTDGGATNSGGIPSPYTDMFANLTTGGRTCLAVAAMSPHPYPTLTAAMATPHAERYGNGWYVHARQATPGTANVNIGGTLSPAGQFAYSVATAYDTGVALIQSAYINTTFDIFGDPKTVTLPNPVTIGNTIIAMCAGEEADPTILGTWTAHTGPVSSYTNQWMRFAHRVAAATTQAFTFNGSAGGRPCVAAVVEVAGRVKGITSLTEQTTGYPRASAAVSPTTAGEAGLLVTGFLNAHQTFETPVITTVAPLNLFLDLERDGSRMSIAYGTLPVASLSSGVSGSITGSGGSAWGNIAYLVEPYIEAVPKTRMLAIL